MIPGMMKASDWHLVECPETIYIFSLTEPVHYPIIGLFAFHIAEKFDDLAPDGRNASFKTLFI